MAAKKSAKKSAKKNAKRSVKQFTMKRVKEAALKKSAVKKAAVKKAAVKKTAVKKAAPTATRASDAPLAPNAPRNRSTGNVPAFPEDYHALYDRDTRAARGITPTAATRESAGHARMSAEGMDADVHYDEATQLPNLVILRQPEASGSRSGGDTPESAVTAFIRNRSDLWGLSDNDANTIEVVSVSAPTGNADGASARRTTRSAKRAGTSDRTDAEGEPPFSVGNLRTVNLIQRIDGKDVFNSDVTAALNQGNEVISVAGQFFPGTSNRAAGVARGATADTSPPAIGEAEAIARAAFDLTNEPYVAADFDRVEASTDEGPYRQYEFNVKRGGARPPLLRPVRIKDVMFPLSEGQFVPGYYLELWVKGYPAFSYVMEADDSPELLYRKNLTSQVAFKYRVHNMGGPSFRPLDGPAPGTPHPTGKPDGFQAKTVAETLVALDSLPQRDPWLPATANTTDGNNCIAYADLRGATGFTTGDVMGKATAARSFDYKYDHSKPARDPNNLQNSLVGMFFHVNWLHDRWYEAGFDEASGNAQKNNFGRGGIGGDPILAEGNDLSGTDNANMSTPADGSSPVMQMYEFAGCKPLPSRTSNHEALITFHEMGHYVTNRLVGNANGLTNLQGKAMGEGWGDFFAICMTSQAGDNFASGVFAAGGWTDITSTFKNNYYFSIRRYPYSADLTKNPLTFKHIGNNVVLPSGPPLNPSPAGNNEVHNAGEVWCAALWEVFVNLVAKHGHEAAERRMIAYVIGGLKLTPLRPTFIQARDGIISAASAMAAGDVPVVRAGFAKRGMGKGATAPLSNSTSLAGVVESFVP